MRDLNERERYHEHEVLGWALAAELLAYHRHLRVANLHPGDGQYDVLAVRDVRSDAWPGVCEMNRGGSLHVPDPESMITQVPWPDSELALDETIAAIVAASGLQRAKKQPRRPTPHVARFISTALRRGGMAWRCLPVFHDSSGMGGSSVDEEMLAYFDAPYDRLRRLVPQYRMKDPLLGWFALTTGNRWGDDFHAHLLVSLNGEAWLQRQEFPHATRPSWPECSEELLRLIGLGAEPR